MPKKSNHAAITRDWFGKMSPAAQKAYLKAHPNSKYGKPKMRVARPKPAMRKVAATGRPGEIKSGNALQKLAKTHGIASKQYRAASSAHRAKFPQRRNH